MLCRRKLKETTIKQKQYISTLQTINCIYVCAGVFNVSHLLSSDLSLRLSLLSQLEAVTSIYFRNTNLYRYIGIPQTQNQTSQTYQRQTPTAAYENTKTI